MSIKEYVLKKYPNFEYVSHMIFENTINLRISMINEKGICPECKELSTYVHKYHERIFSDISFDGNSVITSFDCPVFKCKNPDCNCKFFIHNYSFLGKGEKYSKEVIEKIISLSSDYSMRKIEHLLEQEKIYIKKTSINQIVNKYKEKVDHKMIILKHDNLEVEKGIKECKVDHVQLVTPHITNEILETMEEKYNFIKKIDEIFPTNGNIKPALYIMSSISARMKQLIATSSVPLALTSAKLIKKIGYDLFERKGNGTYFTEGALRKYIEDIEKNTDIDKDDDLVGYVNKLLSEVNKEVEVNNPINIHALDCTKIKVNLNNKNYENSTVITYEKEKIRGYKLASLRGYLKDEGVFEEVRFGKISTNDLHLSKEMIINSKNIKENDILLMDRGFMDYEFISTLVKKKISVIIPLKSNMDIFKEAVKKAISIDKWEENPTRKNQEIQLVKDLTWYRNININNPMMEDKLDVRVTVVRIKKDRETVPVEIEAYTNDEKYVYIAFMSCANKFTGKQIINYYTKRANIEEDFRQLKEYWEFERFHSTKYKLILFYILTVLIAYNMFILYKSSDIGKKYKNKSIYTITKQERNRFDLKECNTLIVSNKYIGVYDGAEAYEFMFKQSDDSQKAFVSAIKGISSTNGHTN